LRSTSQRYHLLQSTGSPTSVVGPRRKGNLLTLRQTRQLVYDLVCDIRSLERLIDTDDFDLCWILSSLEQREEINKLIQEQLSFDFHKRHEAKAKLKSMIRSTDMPIRDLKEKARCEGIRNYSRLDKGQLLAELRNVEANRSNRNGDSDHAPEGRTHTTPNRLQHSEDGTI
jgi:hypothetical protein